MEVWNMQWNLVVCKKGKPFLSPNIWAKTNKSTHSLDLWHHLGGMQTSRECSRPYAWQKCPRWARPFLTTGMTVFKNPGLIIGWDLFPLANMLKIARLLWLGAFFVVKTKERAILLWEVGGEQLHNWCSFLLMKYARFCEILWTSTRLVSAFWKFSHVQECQQGIHPLWSFKQQEALQR